jgi:DNA end-binding protein Ku
MKQAVWTGTISFGLVSIPIRLYPATEPKDVRFHLYDRDSGRRVHYERVTRPDEPMVFEPRDAMRELPPGRAYEHPADTDDAEDDADLPPAPARRVDTAEIVRGYELPSGDLVTVEDDELEALAPARSRTIEIEEFVDLAEIDPVFYEKSYYVAPGRGGGAEKPYALLLAAMRSAGMVAIGRFVLRTKPHLVAIRPLEKVLALETLYFGDEVRAPDELAVGAAAQVSEREIETAEQLIKALATEWVPEKHADAYREELLDLLRRKTPALAAPDVEPAASPVDDLMAALKASVEAAKKRSSEVEKRRASGGSDYHGRTRRRG